MPSKIQLDENLWFLYICLQKSDLKSIDFAAVGQTTNLKPPAARMRYTRLRRQIESGTLIGTHGTPFSGATEKIAEAGKKRKRGSGAKVEYIGDEGGGKEGEKGGGNEGNEGGGGEKGIKQEGEERWDEFESSEEEDSEDEIPLAKLRGKSKMVMQMPTVGMKEVAELRRRGLGPGPELVGDDVMGMMAPMFLSAAGFGSFGNVGMGVMQGNGYSANSSKPRLQFEV